MHNPHMPPTLRRLAISCLLALSQLACQSVPDGAMRKVVPFGITLPYAPFIPLPIAADKQREWDEAAARKRAKWREREGTVPDPVPSGPSSPSQAPNPFPELWTPRN